MTVLEVDDITGNAKCAWLKSKIHEQPEINTRQERFSALHAQGNL